MFVHPSIDLPHPKGDLEERLGIPISPLCDRRTVKRADSQIGFLNFVVRPAFLLIGEIVPRVQEEVMPVIDANINYWKREKSRMSMMNASDKMGIVLKERKKSAESMNKQSSIEEEGDSSESSSDDTTDKESREAEEIEELAKEDAQLIHSTDINDDEDNREKLVPLNDSEEPKQGGRPNTTAAIGGTT